MEHRLSSSVSTWPYFEQWASLPAMWAVSPPTLPFLCTSRCAGFCLSSASLWVPLQHPFGYASVCSTQCVVNPIPSYLSYLLLYWLLLAIQEHSLHSVSARRRHCGESCIAFREGLPKSGERTNIALYFYNSACRLNPGIVFKKPSQGSKLRPIRSPMN